MLRKRYYEAVDNLFDNIRVSQDKNIADAAKLCADAIEKGHTIHLHDSGHIVDAELFNRAGGFNLLRRFQYGLDINSKARIQSAHEENKDRNLEGISKYVLNSSNVYENDVMIIGSVSGISFNIVDLANEAKKMGVKLIVLTSLTYSKALDSKHPSNKKLYELADVLIDNCAPFGDGMLDVENIKQTFIPASGLSAAYIMWAVMADLLEILLERGLNPGILGSVNNPKNVQFNIDLEDLYESEGL